MDLVGSIIPSEDTPIDDASWAAVIEAIPELEATDTASLANPMTGDLMPIPSPPNLLANITVSGSVVGVLRVPKFRDSIEVAGDAAAVQAVAESAAGHFNSEYQPQ